MRLGRKGTAQGGLTALILIIAGIVMAFTAMMLPPPGQIHESVLYLFAQILIYAGSVFGITAYVQNFQPQTTTSS